ncbi:MAG TPA: N-6 DNA methylase [Ktedonobacteraceae bacterium]|nr:N-6 DNA methylase [Ktedonobacteraceae bacterium]
MQETGRLFDWYEADLPSAERKRRGHFSTPPALVSQILDACGYVSDANLSRIRVLDPACGSGNFLMEAAQRLATSLASDSTLSSRKRASLFQHNLWGFDPDPVACFLAEMRLRTSFEAQVKQDLAASFPLHIHQADSLSLHWEPCVDLFLANPPYLAAKNSDLSGYRSAQQRGQTDSYLLFLDLAFQALRPRGWLGLVLPDPLLARANAAPERLRLLNESTIHHLWHFSGLFAAHVGAVVIIAQKRPPRSIHKISWRREGWPNQLKRSQLPQDLESSHQVPQRLLARQPGAEFRYLLNSESGSVTERFRKQLEHPGKGKNYLLPLSDFFQVRRGEELGRESPLLVELERDCETHYRVLRGGIDIQPYATPSGRWGISRSEIAKPLLRYHAPKLLVVKSTGNLRATVDLQDHIALQTLYLLLPCRPDLDIDDLYFFMALLNSRLLRTYIYLQHTAYKLVQPQIEQHVLARLPVPAVIRRRDVKRISELAQELRSACDARGSVVEWQVESHHLFEKLEGAISVLYRTLLPEITTDKGVFDNGYYSNSPNSRIGREAGT